MVATARGSPPLPLGSKVDQIGIVVADVQAAMDAYLAQFATVFHVFDVDETMARFSGSSPTFRTQFALGQVGATSIELIQPMSGTTIHSEFLERHGPGLHHLGTYAVNLRSSRTRLNRRGYPLLMEGSIDDACEFAYYRAEDMGIILETLHLSPRLPLFLARRARLYVG